MDKKAIVAGETLRVTCPVAGYPIESIVWERDTRVLPINRKQKVFPNGTLIIENVERMSDQATYTCVARNAQGYSARGTLEVQVMGKFLRIPSYFRRVTDRVLFAIKFDRDSRNMIYICIFERIAFSLFFFLNEETRTFDIQIMNRISR